MLALYPSILKKERPDALIVMCDWGGWPKRMVQDAKTMQIPTVGHVEGCTRLFRHSHRRWLQNKEKKTLFKSRLCLLFR